MYDVEGNSLERQDKLEEDDKKVRDVFTRMISDFARHGKIQIDGQDADPFSSKKNNFIQIKAKPSLAGNFRICEMALWSNLAEKLKSDSCSFLDAFNINKILSGTLPLPPLLKNDTVPNLLPNADVLNVPVIKDPLNVFGGNTNKNKKKPVSLLGGFIG